MASHQKVKTVSLVPVAITVDIQFDAEVVLEGHFPKDLYLDRKEQDLVQKLYPMLVELDSEVAKHQKRVEDLLVKVEGKESEAAKFADASEALRKLGKFLGKIQSKKSDAGETLKFFEENSFIRCKGQREQGKKRAD